jgi:predicted nucleic acid-binding protein
MRGRFFLDTNIFVYSFDRGAARKASRARQLIAEAAETGRGVVSYQVVQEFLNVALRRFAQPMMRTDAEQYLTTVLQPMLAVHSSAGLYMAALQLMERYRLGWYDSLIAAAAGESRCEVLYSEDLQSGLKIGDVRVQNPFA